MHDSWFNDPLIAAGLRPARDETGLPGVSRRRFLVLAGVGGFTLAVAARSGSVRAASGKEVASSDEVGPATLNAYVEVRLDGKVRIFAPNPEVGQGVKTSLPMIVAEEMDAAWEDVVVENAPVDSEQFGSQFAGGSLSIPMRWEEMRELGAAARKMLLGAAAERWKVAETELSTEASSVVHAASGRRAAYAELAQAAADRSVPESENLTFKDAKDYRILGRRIGGVDNAALVRGEPLFGSDTRLQGMRFAMYCKCPTLGGRPRSANLDEIRRLPGVIDAFVLDGTVAVTRFDPAGVSVAPGVAIVAETTWQAMKARRALQVDWDLADASSDDTGQWEKASIALLDSDQGEPVSEKGDPLAMIRASQRTHTATYSCDMVSHVQLEPQSCAAWYRDGSIEVWAPSQTLGRAAESLEKLLELPRAKITVHQIRGGGGFGRRLDNDYVREVALISRHIGEPVMLQWSREDDMAFDCFRPPVFHRLTASLDQRGDIEAWNNHTISVSPDGEKPGTSAGFRANIMPEPVLENYRSAVSLVPFKTPTGPVRAPLSNTYAFAEQSFLHELAVAAGRDHREFLLALMGEPRWTDEGSARAINTGRAAGAIKRVTEMAAWGRSLPEGRALGLSFYFSHAGHIAEVAEVSVDQGRRIAVHKVWVAADIGPVVNLSGAENQVQGSIVDGLSTMAAQRITVAAGQVEQGNFDRHPLLRNPSTPEMEIVFIPSDYSPTGVGEPALPPLAAAVCNAVYTVTGQRIRRLPIINEGFSIA